MPFDVHVKQLVRALGVRVRQHGAVVQLRLRLGARTHAASIGPNGRGCDKCDGGGYLDLLFFHRRLQRLVAIELKIGDFKPADSGQMELYLRWLDRHERQSSEQPPLGIILCAGKKRETVEYLDLDTRGIHVAEYLTELPPREVLEERLHRAIEAARNRLVLAGCVDVEMDADSTGGPTARRKGRTK